MAISAMGNSNEIGKRLNKQHKPKTEWSLIALTAVIAIIGGVVMFMDGRAFLVIGGIPIPKTIPQNAQKFIKFK
ncbi:MAG: hypothetical protein GX387_02430 [Clostridium sp.]|jgi:hypothetical protein|nr:hypothetical protein [Clostridium sp.]